MMVMIKVMMMMMIVMMIVMVMMMKYNYDFNDISYLIILFVGVNGAELMSSSQRFNSDREVG